MRKNIIYARHLKYELGLIKPLYVILQDNKAIFEDHWQARTEAYESLVEEDIQRVLIYTKKKLNDLLIYFSTIKFNNRSKEIMCFYTDYVNHLLSYHKNHFDMRYHLQYMYFYSELLLGAQRYLTIRDRLNEIESELKPN